MKACVIEPGVFITAGNNVKEGDVNGPEECASRCALTSGCVAWTFLASDSYCWLKSDASEKGKSDGWITGTKSCGFKCRCS